MSLRRVYAQQIHDAKQALVEEIHKCCMNFPLIHIDRGVAEFHRELGTVLGKNLPRLNLPELDLLFLQYMGVLHTAELFRTHAGEELNDIGRLINGHLGTRYHFYPIAFPYFRIIRN